MSSRRRKSSPFSLFSFQDIVTSVTAVIILLTLILSLELVTRATTSTTVQQANTMAELRAAVEQAEQEASQLKQQLESDTEQTVLAASKTRESARRDVEQTQAQIEQLRGDLAELQRRQSALQLREDAALARTLEQDGQRQALQDLEGKKRAIEDQRRQLQEEDRLIFNLRPGTTKHPWLVDVSADRVVVLPVGHRGQRAEFASQVVKSCTKQMQAWASRTCHPEQDYFVLLVRPSGIENMKTLHDHLRSQGYDIGLELIGPTRKVATAAAKAPQ